MVLWLLSLYHFWSLFSFLFVTYQLYHNNSAKIKIYITVKSDSRENAEKALDVVSDGMKGLLGIE